MGLMEKKYSIDMTNGNLYKQILLFALPLMASSVLQLLFNAADVVVVGKFAGDTSLAAVSSTSSLVGLVVNSFIGLTGGTNVVLARYIGSKDVDKSQEVVHTSITLGLIIGAFLILASIFVVKPALAMMGSPADVIDLSALYLKIYFFGAPANLVYNFGAAGLRAKGDTKRPLYFLTVAGITNVLLNLLLVIVFRLDVAGVAIATIASQYISAVLVMYCLINEDEYLRFDYHKLGIKIDSLKSIMSIGVPSMFQSIAFSLSNVVIQSTVNSFGSTVMAGNGAAASVEGFSWAVMNGFVQAAQTFNSQNLGARKLSRINQTMRVCMIYVIIAGLISGIGGWYFGPFFLRIYTDSPDVVAAGMIRLTYFLKPYVIFGMQDVVAGASRGLGSSFAPMVCSLLFTCVLRIFWVKVPFKYNPTLDYLYWSYPLSWIFTLIFQVLIYIIAYRRIVKKFETQE